MDFTKRDVLKSACAAAAASISLPLMSSASRAQSRPGFFAAKDIAAGPIARVLIPFRVPSGFHCNFYAEDNPLYQQTLSN